MALAPEPTPSRKAIVASLIAENMTLEGGLSGDGELQIDGTIKGDVKVSKVSIGETGRVEGSVQAESIEIRGKVSGEVTAKQVRLYNTAHVEGDITHEQLAMEVGAFFQGRSIRFQRQAATQVTTSPTPKIAAPAATPSVSTSGETSSAAH
jgi:cytoskeletal protein CcmA (bactofilin family)